MGAPAYQQNHVRHNLLAKSSCFSRSLNFQKFVPYRWRHDAARLSVTSLFLQGLPLSLTTTMTTGSMTTSEQSVALAALFRRKSSYATQNLAFFSLTTGDSREVARWTSPRCRRISCRRTVGSPPKLAHFWGKSVAAAVDRQEALRALFRSTRWVVAANWFPFLNLNCERKQVANETPIKSGNLMKSNSLSNEPWKKMVIDGPCLPTRECKSLVFIWVLVLLFWVDRFSHSQQRRFRRSH